MDLGLEKLNNESVDVSSEVIRIFEECGLADQMFVQEITTEQKIHSVESILKDISALPKEEKDIVIKFFSSDESMKQLIQASEEGQKIQDFLRWGPGIFIGMYLGSFSRIKKVISASRGLWRTNTLSQYLPMEKDTKEILDGSEKILAALKTGNSKQITDVCKKYGAKVDEATDTDWAASIGSFLGHWLLNTAVPGLGLVGCIAGKYLSEKARTTVEDKGYTREKLDTYAKQVVKLIDIAQGMKNSSIQIDADAKPVYNKLFKMVCQALSTIGRGICATLSKNI